MKTNEQEENEQKRSKPETEGSEHQTNQTSEGHAGEGGEGNPTTTNEPILRSATTDSSRAPKNSTDDGTTGGNVR